MDLTTPRLTIRYMKEADIDRYYPMCNTKFATKYRLMYKMIREETLDYLHQMMDKKRDFAVALRDTDEFIGQIHLDSDPLRFGVNSVSLAYWVGEPYARQGYMSEALGVLIPRLFETYDVISAQVVAQNTASHAMLQKLGFTREGCIRKALCYEGIVYDDVHYSLLKEEFGGE